MQHYSTINGSHQEIDYGNFIFYILAVTLKARIGNNLFVSLVICVRDTETLMCVYVYSAQHL